MVNNTANSDGSDSTMPAVSRALIGGGALVMALGVILGAVSVHASKGAAHPDAARLLQTAVLYQLIHGLAVVIEGTLARDAPSKLLVAAGVLHLAGVAAFSGSLYLLAFTGVSLGAVGPSGGAAFIAGWLALAVFAFTAR
jgi:uncharacterized membrane protein YgdD (TMEM256/DUF423 family)